MRKIAIIDDELHICESIDFALKQAGFTCDIYTNPVEALSVMEKELPDLVVLDIIMPEMDGLEVCRRLRKFSETLPILFLSSKDEEFDRVLGLELGADDYLCKPFSMKELIARIKVNLRRSGLMGTNPSSLNYSVKTRNLSIDMDTYAASYFDQPLKLTVTEFRILAALVSETGKVKTREQLLNHAFPSDYHVNDRTIDTHIKRIRKKLVAVQADCDPIETVFGVGYKFND